MMLDYVRRRNWYTRFPDSKDFGNVHFLLPKLTEAAAHTMATRLASIWRQERVVLVMIKKEKT